MSQSDPNANAPADSSTRPAAGGRAITTRRGGGFRLFRLWGVDVYLHWLWILVAVYEIQYRVRGYSSVGWNIAEYLTLFLIVLMHEFGHAMACRSVGGEANHILLWPLGGVAYVRPPARPGAVLWSIVAGPLVNVVLLPITIGLYMMSPWPRDSDIGRFIGTVAWMNALLLIFNLLPIYPLDGGKILWALLWFVLGQARALMVACVLGIVGTIAALAAMFAFSPPDAESRVWILVLGVFALMQSWSGLTHARRLAQALALPRNTAYTCPSCREAPPANVGWRCQRCGAVYDLFGAAATCPECELRVENVPCPLCGVVSPIGAWIGGRPQLEPAEVVSVEQGIRQETKP